MVLYAHRYYHVFTVNPLIRCVCMSCRRIRYLKSYDTFRTTFIYSNILYGLAMRMTEMVGRGRWEELVKKHFFQPLGMKRSTFSTEADLNESNTAKPFVVYNGNLEPVSYDLPRSLLTLM